MENRNNRELNQNRNYFEPLMSVNSSKDFSSSINKGNKNQYIRNIFFNQNHNFFITNNLQNKIPFDKINNISLIRKKELKRFNTEKHLRKLNLNSNNSNFYIMPEDEEIIFAKKTNMYTNKNNNGKSKNMIQNREAYIHTNDDSIARKINQNYNPKYLSGTKNNNSLITSKINNNTLLGKKSSNNIITYNHNLNTTMPIKYRRFSSNNLIKLNNMLSIEKKLSSNQTIIKKDNNINDSFFANSQKKNTNKKNVTKNLRIMIDNKNKRRKTRNDLSWDYSIGILNRGQNYIIKKNSSLNKNRNFLSNYYSERNKLNKEMNVNTFNDDEIGDKDIDEIVDNLDTFFNDEKKNNTVILNDKGFSDDSLSDIADDIVKTFQDIDNKDKIVQMTDPSSPNHELDTVINNNTDKQYNNNYLSQKKIIYETKSTVKPTIVNNFFISPGTQNKFNNIPKDINYNLFVVNEYNNKINSNSTIPTLVTQTYKSPEILRGDKNNPQLYNGIGESEISDFCIDNENINNNINNKDNQGLIQNQKLNQNIIIDLNYSNDINNNINPNINNNINNTLNTLNINGEINNNNIRISPINTNEINNINNNFNLNNYYLNDEELILNNNNQSKINSIKNNYEYNKNLVKKLNTNIQKVNFKPNNSFKNNIRKKKTEEMKMNDSSLKNIFTSNNINNIRVFKNPNNKKINIKNIDNKYLLKNIIKNKRKITKPNNSLDNNKNINKNNYQYNSSKNINNINKNNNISPNNKNYYININNNNNISMNSINIDNTIQNNLASCNNILIKNRKHISFNLNDNIFIKFKKDDLINNSEITTQNGKIFNHIEKNMDLYKSELKMIKPKPIIKKFLSKDIKINKDYVLVENLQERQILPEFYDDFEEEDIKSLEKSLERSIDKILY